MRNQNFAGAVHAAGPTAIRQFLQRLRPIPYLLGDAGQMLRGMSPEPFRHGVKVGKGFGQPPNQELPPARQSAPARRRQA